LAARATLLRCSCRPWGCWAGEWVLGQLRSGTYRQCTAAQLLAQRQLSSLAVALAAHSAGRSGARLSCA
jgi:hypothetical protein